MVNSQWSMVNSPPPRAVVECRLHGPPPPRRPHTARPYAPPGPLGHTRALRVLPSSWRSGTVWSLSGAKALWSLTMRRTHAPKPRPGAQALSGGTVSCRAGLGRPVQGARRDGVPPPCRGLHQCLIPSTAVLCRPTGALESSTVQACRPALCSPPRQQLHPAAAASPRGGATRWARLVLSTAFSRALYGLG